MVIISPLVFCIRSSSRSQITASSGQPRCCRPQIIKFHQNKNTGSLITRTISNYKYAGSDLTLRKFIKSIKFVTHFTIKFKLSQKNLSQFSLRMTFNASTRVLKICINKMEGLLKIFLSTVKNVRG